MNDLTPISAVAAAHIIARRLSPNRAEREDLASVALLGLLEHAHRHEIDAEEMLAQPHWRVLQCRAMDRVRQQRRQRSRWRELAESYVEPRLATAPLRDKIDVNKAITVTAQRLDVRERVVLDRVFLGGETLADVARDQGWSHPAARRRRFGLLRALRTSIGEVTTERRAHAPA